MPDTRLRRNYNPKVVALNIFVSALSAFAAGRVGTVCGFSHDAVSAFAGIVGYMGAMSTEFVVTCIRDHNARKREGKA